MDNLAGQNVKGYELQERIAAGGFGAVYRAQQSTVGREVAVKVILPGLANKPAFIRRFEAEAQTIARLEHMNIVPLYDYWREPDGAYLVMRYLRGGSLYDQIHTQGAFNIEDAFNLFMQVAHGLHVAHRSQVVHRDIKPSNILLDEDGNGYLADFGIAKDHTLKQSLTEPDSFIGSPEYIAPEQARSEPVTPQTDIYSLGIVLYEMLAGEHPFPRLDKITYLYKHLNDPLPEITSLDDRINDEVNAVIQKATAKDPRKRYSDVLEMLQALRQAAQLGATITPTSLVELLTPREQEVMQLIIDNKSNREIADRLVLTEGTIKSYIRRIYKKLHVRSRVQAIARVRDLNFVIKKPETSPGVSTRHLLEPENPYKGLQAFKEADAQHFFGREKLTQKLLGLLQENGEYHRFLSIVGPSGSGKSSVVKAGLIPALWRGALPGSENWYIVNLVPGNRPLDELEVALYRNSDDRSINLREQLQRDSFGLLRVADLILPDDDSELLVVIDQFEEVFTLLEDEAQRKHFLDLIRECVTDKRSRVRVIVTLRADYYDRPLQYPEFGELLRERVETLLPLSADELERAINEPAQGTGVKFEDGLVSRIVSDVHYQPGALPLLQYALTELFEHRDDRLLTLEAYEAIGGTGGALAKRADEIYLEGNDTGQELVRQLFLRLVTLGEGAEDTRRRVDRSELLAITPDTELMDEIIDLYAQSRLLSLDNDPATRRPTVEVAHEAILREWDRLRQWLNESRDDIRQQRQIAQAAEAWRTSNHDQSYLLTGTRLVQAEKWRKDTELALTPLESEFIDASIQEAKAQELAEKERLEREKAQERRSRALLRTLVAVFAVATIVAGTLAVFAFAQRNEARSARATSDANLLIAERNAREFRSVALANAANNAVDDHQPDMALALAAEAVNMENPPREARLALLDLVRIDWIRQRYIGHEGRLVSVDFSPDGTKAVTAGLDNRAILWDVATGEKLKVYQPEDPEISLGFWSSSVLFHPTIENLVLLGTTHLGIIAWNTETDEVEPLPGGEGLSFVLTFSSDGHSLLASHQEVMVLVDMETGAIIQTFEGHEAGVSTADFSSDERLVVTSSYDGSARIWDVETGELLQTLDHSSWNLATVFMADDERIISIDIGESMAYMWDWESGEILRTYESDALWLYDFALSPDEQFVVAGDETGTAYLWTVETGTLVRTYHGHESRIQRLKYSPDGKHILSVSNDGTAILWDAAGFGAQYTISDESNDSFGLAIMPSGENFAIPARDNIINIHDIRSGQVIKTIHTNVDNPILHAYTHDGRYIIISETSDNGTYVWDVETDELAHDISTGKGYAIRTPAMSADGTMFAAGARIEEPSDNAIFVWNTETWELVTTLENAGDLVEGIVFSPDENTLFSTSRDQKIRMWDVQTGELLGIVAEGLGPLRGVDISSDGQRLLVSAGQSAILVDITTGDQLMSFSGHAGLVQTATFSPDERHILTTANERDGTLILWDATTGEPINRLAGHTPDTLFGAFTPDGEAIISYSHVRTSEVTVWDVKQLLEDYESWILNNRYIPDFTCEQRDLYFIEPLCDTEAP